MSFHSTKLLALSTLAILLLTPTSSLHAQVTSPATGVSPAAAQPVYPNVAIPCAVIQAETGITTGLSQWDSTVQASEPNSEVLDTQIQSKLTSCGSTASSSSPQLVELTLDIVHSKSAFVIAPLTIPAWVTLQIDAGVTVFGSRNPCDYQQGGTGYCWNVSPYPSNPSYQPCGTLGAKNASLPSCYPLITIATNTSSSSALSSAIMGYGVIDARGGDSLITPSGTTFVNITKPTSPTQFATCTVFSFWCIDTVSLAQTDYYPVNSPYLLLAQQANNFSLYKVTLRNSPKFNVIYEGAVSPAATTTGFIAWGVKIIEPQYQRNTDGIDPGTNVSNVTIRDSYINNGDDNIAIKSPASGAVSNVSILNLHTYSGLGVQVGSQTVGGVTNVLVNGVYQSGNTAATKQSGFGIKSSPDEGGTVSNATFENVCMQNQIDSIRFYTNYDGNASTGLIPIYTGIFMRNITVLPNSAGTNTGDFEFSGYSTNPADFTISNLQLITEPPTTGSHGSSYGTVYGGVNSIAEPSGSVATYFPLASPPPPVVESSNMGMHWHPYSFYSSGGVNSTNVSGFGLGGPDTDLPTEATNTCANNTSTFPNIVVDTFVQHGNDYGNETNLQTASRVQGQTFTLVAVVIPSTTGAPPTGKVEFMDVTTSPATPLIDPSTGLPYVATSMGNGTTWYLTLNGSPVYGTGTHRFGAEYIGSDYPSDTATFGNVVVTVTP